MGGWGEVWIFFGIASTLHSQFCSLNFFLCSSESNHWRYAAIGIAAGAAAVVAAPLVLGAAGFSAVASGSAFALIKSAGVVGIGAAGKSAAIGGISGGIAALGTKMFVCLNQKPLIYVLSKAVFTLNPKHVWNTEICFNEPCFT